MKDSRIAVARQSIDSLDLDPSDYRQPSTEELADLGIGGDALGANDVLLRGEPRALSLQLRGSGQGNRILINAGLGGTISVGLDGNGGTLYFGRDVTLRDLHIGSRQDDDFIAVGNDVASTGPGRWVSGLRAGSARPALIVGDCCVISHDVVLRNSDGHPLFDQELNEQQNQPRGHLVIEPHVWLGERCAVLKDVTVGAFSVVGFGSVVTRPVPRHHAASGSPASSRPLQGRVWAWDDSNTGLQRARAWLERYPPPR